MRATASSSRLVHRVVVVVASLAVSALAGAGSCEPSDTNSDVNNPAPCDLNGTCPGVGGSGGGSSGGSSGGGVTVVDDGTRDAAWVAFEGEVVQRVNALRAQGGSCGSGASVQTFAPSGPLHVDGHLVAAARAHADDMAARRYFAHDSLDGRTAFDRMQDAGYTGFASAENIAAGQITPADVVEAWRTSPGHCSNLYNGSLNEVGVGYGSVVGSPYVHYWVQDFGTR